MSELSEVERIRQCLKRNIANRKNGVYREPTEEEINQLAEAMAAFNRELGTPAMFKRIIDAAKEQNSRLN